MSREINMQANPSEARVQIFEHAHANVPNNAIAVRVNFRHERLPNYQRLRVEYCIDAMHSGCQFASDNAASQCNRWLIGTEQFSKFCIEISIGCFGACDILWWLEFVLF